MQTLEDITVSQRIRSKVTEMKQNIPDKAIIEIGKS